MRWTALVPLLCLYCIITVQKTIIWATRAKIPRNCNLLQGLATIHLIPLHSTEELFPPLLHWLHTAGCGTALQVGRSRVRFPMVSLEVFVYRILAAELWPWGRLKNISWEGGRGTDWLSRNLGASTSWNPQGLSRPVQGLLYFTTSIVTNIFLCQDRRQRDTCSSKPTELGTTNFHGVISHKCATDILHRLILRRLPSCLFH
jgi:hypothetical protein